jgi:hypothetical protein
MFHLARFAALIIATCTTAMIGSGCAAPCVPSAGCRAYGQSGGEDLVCINEPQTGSHVVETRCYSRSEVDARRKTDHQILEKAQMNSNRPHHGRRDP